MIENELSTKLRDAGLNNRWLPGYKHFTTFPVTAQRLQYV